MAEKIIAVCMCLGCLIIGAGICEFLWETPRQLKRIANELEKWNRKAGDEDGS